MPDFRRFNQQVNDHTALDEVFFHWGVPLTTGALDRWEKTDTRGILSLSTAPGGGSEIGTPREVARGLKDLGMPRIYRAKRNDSPIYDRLDVAKVLKPPKVAFMWTPLTRGSPNVPGNDPNDYFPGRKYVDWVGTDVYAKFGNETLFRNLTRFFNHKRGFPFILAEYGAWDNDVSGAFTRRIHEWSRKRKRVRALVYFRSVDRKNEFNLQHYPGAETRCKTSSTGTGTPRTRPARRIEP